MRTNIDIDDKLMKQAMEATGATTKRATVDAALRKLLDVKARERILERAMRSQEAGRRAAIREGRLREWHAELVRTGSKLEEAAHANQHRDR